MSKTGIWYEYEYLRRKYFRSGRHEKSAILDDLCNVLGCHRKHAIRLMSKKSPGRKRKPSKRGRKSKYDCARFQKALKRLWLDTEQMCSKHLKVAIPEWLPFFERKRGELDNDVREKLLAISPATIDRILKPSKAKTTMVMSSKRTGVM